jgi:HD-GYP domain-containing protein (c-di-GMP phosphodiesterase class II)
VPLRPAFIDESLIGRLLPWDLYTASGVLVARAGARVADRSQYTKLIARSLFRQSDAIQPGANPAVRLRQVVAELPASLRKAGTPELETGVRAHARTLIALAGLDYDALLGLSRLLPMRDPAARHCLLTAIVALDLGELLGLPDAGVESLTAAALTMNIAALKLHAELAAGLETFDADVRADMRRHPERSAKLLEAGGLADPAWLAAVRQHHENLDGSGYPRGLRDEEICQSARILRVADYYVAKVTSRRYRPPKSAKSLLRLISGKERGCLDAHIARTLLRRHGGYPSGTLVRLASRQVAVIIRRSGQADGAHVAVAFMDYRGRLLAQPAECNTASVTHAILDVTEAEARWPAIGWEAFWGY